MTGSDNESEKSYSEDEDLDGGVNYYANSGMKIYQKNLKNLKKNKVILRKLI